MRARLLSALRWAWLAGTASLAAHGLLSTIRAVPRWEPGRFNGPMASTDHMLAFLLVPRPSGDIAAALSGIPESEAVLFVGRAGASDFAQTYFGVASAALPRPVADLRCGEGGAPPVRRPQAGIRYGAVVLHGPAQPVDDPRAVKVGESLTVLRGHPGADPGSLCSTVVPATGRPLPPPIP